jgi:hypothetical protein
LCFRRYFIVLCGSFRPLELASACNRTTEAVHTKVPPPEFRKNIVEMPDVNALQRSDLNTFLFADIGTEANGTTLSVLSVFARGGSDPWTEAARLAALPKAVAADALAHMIAGMPKSLWALPDAFVIAVRLIGLLPARPAVAEGIRRTARQWPVRDIGLVGACAALVIAFVIMMIRQ